MADVNLLAREVLSSISPYKLVQKCIRFDKENHCMYIQGKPFTVAKNIRVIAFGKAVLGMVEAIENILDSHIVGGVAIVPRGMINTMQQEHPHYLPNSRIRTFEAGQNNLPNKASVVATREIIKEVTMATGDDIIITLVSGGGSALLVDPAGVTLEDKIDVTQSLSRAGASIQELNTVRCHLSTVKGGKLARLASPAKVINLILSDVIGNPLHIIASGPTIHQIPADPMPIVDKYRLELPKHVEDVLKKSYSLTENTIELAKEEKVTNVLVGDNTLATRSLVESYSRLGYSTFVWSHSVDGMARHLGDFYAGIVRRRLLVTSDHTPMAADNGLTLPSATVSSLEIERLVTYLLEARPPFCVIGSGECTVAVLGHGKGGRNQETVLSFALSLYKVVHFEFPHLLRSNMIQCTFASFGTDGQDGPTDAAGAQVILSDLIHWDVQEMEMALNDNDSYTYFASKGNCLLKTGLSGTNVLDIHALVFI